MEKLYSIIEALPFFPTNYTEHTLRRAARLGIAPFFKIGKRYVISQSALDRFMNEQLDKDKNSSLRGREQKA